MFIFGVLANTIRDCSFAGINQAVTLLEINSECSTTDLAPMSVENCDFVDFHGVPPRSGVTAINVRCYNQTSGLGAEIDSCIFSDGSASSSQTPGIAVASDLLLSNCVFQNLAPTDRPDLYGALSFGDTVVARNNSFLPPGIAAGGTGRLIDARENWWGDSTGPHNLNENPDGQGSDVANGVLFIPWLTHPPDTTTDTTHVSIEEPTILQPSSFALSAFPNPFNATTRLYLDLPVGISQARIIVFNVLGQVVKQMSVEVLTPQVEIELSSGEWPSGIYFAQAQIQDASETVKLVLLK
ncbi:MAG: T9SS type A sorting domain-containing protein [bacterium]|nr:T9SS type A sorting domain-containing protein [bacterium]